MTKSQTVDAGDKRPTIIFLHIPKTAGLTLYQIINRQYSQRCIFTIGGLTELRQFEQLELSTRLQFDLVRGHMEFGLHTLIPQPTSYFTFLREPITRVISYYYFQRKGALDPLRLMANRLDLKSYVESNLDPLVDNLQTRMLAAKWYSVPVGQLRKSALEVAKTHLREHFDIVGLTDRFDETLVMLQQAYRWKRMYYSRLNVGRSRPQRDALPRETIEAIEKVNQLDLELYAHAQDIFSQQIERLGPSFAESVRSFQVTNKRLQPILKTYWAMRRVSVRHLSRQLLRRMSYSLRLGKS